MNASEKHVVDILNEVKITGSTKKKQEMFQRFFSDEDEGSVLLLLNVLHAALADNKRYGVVLGDIPRVVSDNKLSLGEVLDQVENGMPYTTNAKKEELHSLIWTLDSSESRDLLIRIINKDLNIGIGTTTLNKVLEKNGFKTIRNLTPMKAKREKAGKSIMADLGVGEVFVQVKVDAARAFLVVNRDEKYILSSTGKRTDALTNITDSISDNTPEFIIDGEVVALNDNGSLMNRQKSNGLFNKAIKGTITEEESNKFVFIAWDMIRAYKMSEYTDHVEDLLYREFQMPAYKHRLDLLRDLDGIGNDGHIRVVETHHARSDQEIAKISQEFIERGEEGAIVKTVGHSYKPTRSSELVKIKKAFMADVRITGVNEGKNVGTLGSLSYETDDGKIKGDVSGISDKDKERWWVNPSEIIGKVVELRYMEVTTDKSTGEFTLYGPPAIIRIRDDKNETSTLENLT